MFLKPIIRHLFALICCLSTVSNFAQSKEVEFKDGTTLSYEILERTTDNAKRLMVRAAFGSIGLGIQYMKPDRFLIDAGASMYSGAYAGLVWGIWSGEKEKVHRFSVKEVDHISWSTSYLITNEKIVYTNLLGLHGGVRYFDERLHLKSPMQFILSKVRFKSVVPYTGSSFIGGLAYYRTGYIKYVVKEENSDVINLTKETNRFGLLFDLLYSPQLNYLVYHPLHDAMEQYDEYRKLGFLVTFDVNKTWSVSEGYSGWGSSWQLSAGYGPAGFLWLVGMGFAF